VKHPAGAHASLRATIDRDEHAGGLLGALVGGPLRAALGPAGAVIVLVAAGGFGLLLIVGTQLRQIAHAGSVAGRFLGQQIRVLMTMPPSVQTLDADGNVVDLAGAERAAVYDVEADAGEDEEYEDEDEYEEDAEYEEEDGEEYEEEEEEEEEEGEYGDED